MQKTFSRDTSGELHTQITLKVNDMFIILIKMSILTILGGWQVNSLTNWFKGSGVAQYSKVSKSHKRLISL